MNNNKNKRKTIRPSPTISRMIYDTLSMYGFQLSTYIERKVSQDILGNEVVNDILFEIELSKRERDFYKTQQSLIQKKIEKTSNRIANLESCLEDDMKEKIAENMQGAQSEIMSLQKEERERREKKEKKKVRYVHKYVPIEDVELICERYNVTPKMVLPMIDRRVLRDYFEKYEKYLK